MVRKGSVLVRTVPLRESFSVFQWIFVFLLSSYSSGMVFPACRDSETTKKNKDL
jgi:hypothetical protein